MTNVKIRKAAAIAEIVSAIAVIVGMRGFVEVLSDTKPYLSDPFVELLNSR